MRRLLPTLAAFLAVCLVQVGGRTEAADPPDRVDVPPSRAYLAQVLYGAPRPFYPRPYGWGATPAGSYAHGFAAMLRARGDYNLLTARARVAKAEARRYEIENRLSYAEAYFKLRELNREWRAKLRGPRPTAEDLARYAEARRPDRLSPSELDPITGEISWPILLQTDRYAWYRGRLEGLFLEWARSDQLSPTSHLKIDRMTKAVLAELRNQVRGVPQMDYVAAKRFVRSLAYEARLPTG